MLRWTKLAALATVFGAAVGATGAVTPWERYLETPTPENAHRVTERSYDRRDVTDEDRQSDLWLLDDQVVASDGEAVRLAFRLLPGSEGDEEGTLMVILGRLVRIDPRLFLEGLRERRRDVARLDDLLGSFGDEYADRDEAQAYELSHRRRALLSVADRRLRVVREECLAVLKDLQREYGNAAPVLQAGDNGVRIAAAGPEAPR